MVKPRPQRSWLLIVTESQQPEDYVDNCSTNLESLWINVGYRVNEQTQRGVGGTGKSVGELDMLVFNDSNEPWTIIEALRVANNQYIKVAKCRYSNTGDSTTVYHIFARIPPKNI